MNIVYIVCHDDKSEEQAKMVSDALKNCTCRVIKIGKSPLFENQAFCVMNDEYDTWKDANFVGIITYSLVQKSVFDLDIQNIIDLNPTADVISLASFITHVGNVSLDVYQHALLCHGKNFITAWVTLLEGLGIAKEDIIKPITTSIYCNCFLAKPQAMIDYIGFNLKCQDMFTNNDVIRDSLMLPAIYQKVENNLTTQEVHDICGQERWPQTPFVFERLAMWYFEGKYVVCTGVRVIHYKAF